MDGGGAMSEATGEGRRVEPDVVVSYWRGALPAVAELHLLSFLVHSETSRYHLYLDGPVDQPAPVSTLLAHPRVTVSSISIEQLLRDAGIPAMAGTLRGVRGALLRFIYRVIAVLTRTRLMPVAMPAAWFVSLIRLGTVAPNGWFCLYHHRPSSGAIDDLPYRADLFRCLIPGAHPGKSVLYLDLDTVVTAPLSELDWRRSFTYRWERYAFANTAILFLSEQDGAGIHRRVVERLRTAPNAKPWAFYTQKFCDDLGLQIHPTEAFDPLWDPSSLWRGKAERFMTAHEDSKAMTQELLERFPIAHWHNQWRTVPDAGSAYRLLLERYRVQWDASKPEGRPA